MFSIILQKNMHDVYCRIVDAVSGYYGRQQSLEVYDMLDGFLNAYYRKFKPPVVFKIVAQNKQYLKRRFDFYLECMLGNSLFYEELSEKDILFAKPEIKKLLYNSKYRNYLLNELEFKDVTSDGIKYNGDVCYKSKFGPIFVFSVMGIIYYMEQENCEKNNIDDLFLDFNIMSYVKEYVVIHDQDLADSMYKTFIWKFLNIQNALLANKDIIAELPDEILNKYHSNFKVTDVTTIRNIDVTEFCPFIKDMCNYLLEHDSSKLLKLTEINDLCLTPEVLLLHKII
jgi:hypothetical protein